MYFFSCTGRHSNLCSGDGQRAINVNTVDHSAIRTGPLFKEQVPFAYRSRMANAMRKKVPMTPEHVEMTRTWVLLSPPAGVSSEIKQKERKTSN